MNETVEQINARMAAWRADPCLAYVGRLWCELEFEQQADVRRYVAAGRLTWEGKGPACRVVAVGGAA